MPKSILPYKLQPKDGLVTEFETEHDKYVKNVKDIKNSSEEMVVRAEELLGPQPQPVSTAGTGPEMFKPQSNLKLSFLDKQASHLEVHKCAQGAETPPPRVSGHI